METVYDDGEIVDESAEYSPKSEFSKPAICFQASQKCIEVRAKEMKKGYFNTTFSKDGLPLKTWIEDSRKAYCSAVTALKLLLLPEILEEEDESKSEKKNKFRNLEEDFETLFEEYAYCKIKRISDGKYKKDESDFYMPEADAVVDVIENHDNGIQLIKQIPGFWNKQIEEYWNEMVKLNDILFSELMRVIHRKNYFKQEIRYG